MSYNRFSRTSTSETSFSSIDPNTTFDYYPTTNKWSFYNVFNNSSGIELESSTSEPFSPDNIWYEKDGNKEILGQSKIEFDYIGMMPDDETKLKISGITFFDNANGTYELTNDGSGYVYDRSWKYNDFYLKYSHTKQCWVITKSEEDPMMVGEDFIYDIWGQDVNTKNPWNFSCWCDNKSNNSFELKIR